MLVLYHDDPDGLFSAALTNAFITNFLGFEESHHHIPVNYHLKADWLQAKLPLGQAYALERIAIVDFMYHPDAFLYWDHHATAFLTDKYRQHYEERTKPLSLWSTDYGSCGRLIFERLRGCWPTMDHFEPLAIAADMVDTADYPSVEAFFAGKVPAIALSHAYHLFSEGQKSEIIRQLTTRPLEAVLDVVRAEVDAAIAGNQLQLKHYANIVESRGQVAFTTLHGSGLSFLRYAPYYYCPKARYALTIHFPNGGTAISIGRNPWLPRDAGEIDLGAVAKQFGGGGHPYAAGISFAAKAYADALKAANQMIEVLNAKQLKAAA